MKNLTLTQDEKNLVVAALMDFVNSQKQDLDRAEQDPDWSEKWGWV